MMMTVIIKLSLESCSYHGYHSNVYGDENLISFRVLSDCYQTDQYPAVKPIGPDPGICRDTRAIKQLWSSNRSASRFWS